MNSTTMTGVHGQYHWLETDHRLTEFLDLCSQAILGKYVVISAVDSGSFVPSAFDQSNGWTENGGLAYSPRIQSKTDLPENSHGRDCGGFDEWYVFEVQQESLGVLCHENIFTAKLTPGNVFAFINFYGFLLSDIEMEPIARLFWRQMEWMQPESYLADGSARLIFATRNKELFESVSDSLRQSV
jgi:hypothetical protein